MRVLSAVARQSGARNNANIDQPVRLSLFLSLSLSFHINSHRVATLPFQHMRIALTFASVAEAMLSTAEWRSPASIRVAGLRPGWHFTPTFAAAARVVRCSFLCTHA
mmetsp:Transcript_7731/g.23137  ORF Transcript_7731/g.23137 Transcript_7731/m.23137 type:complete len:107 (-) Transcript_7731:15-335(-)